MQSLQPIEVIEHLPSLIERAATAVADACTPAEKLEALELAGFAYDAATRTVRIAKAKGAPDELIAAAIRAQADALMIEARARARLRWNGMSLGSVAARIRGAIPRLSGRWALPRAGE